MARTATARKVEDCNISLYLYKLINTRHDFKMTLFLFTNNLSMYTHKHEKA